MGVDSWGGPYLACPAPGQCCCHHDGAEHNGSFSQRPPRLKAPSLRTHSAHELAATVGYVAPAPGSTVVSPLPHILPCPKLFSARPRGASQQLRAQSQSGPRNVRCRSCLAGSVEGAPGSGIQPRVVRATVQAGWSGGPFSPPGHLRGLHALP